MNELDFLKELVKIYSPTGDVDEAVIFLMEKLDEFKLNPVYDEGGYISCEAGENQEVLLCGHVDTVPGRIDFKLTDRMIAGRGVVDAKSPLASMIYALKELVDEGFEFSRGVNLLIVTDEEGDGKSSIEAVRKLVGKKIKYAIVGEPTRTYGVAVSYYGRAAVEITARGREVHASACGLIENPIEEVCGILSRIKRELRETLACPTMISGGRLENTLPSECKLILDVRIPPESRYREELDLIKSIVKEANLRSKLRVSCEVYSFSKPYELSPDSALVKAFVEEISRNLGRRAVLLRKRGTCDVNLISEVLGIDVVAYGPGNPRLSHSNIERLRIKDYLDAIKVLKGVLKRLCK